MAAGVYTVDGDINDTELLVKLFDICKFTHVLHLAAQVDTSSWSHCADLCCSPAATGRSSYLEWKVDCLCSECQCLPLWPTVTIMRLHIARW